MRLEAKTYKLRTKNDFSKKGNGRRWVNVEGAAKKNVSVEVLKIRSGELWH